MINKGKATTTIAILFLFALLAILTTLGNQPDLLLRIGIPPGALLFIAAICIGLADFFNPQLQEVAENKKLLQFTTGGILTVLVAAVNVILTIIISSPQLLEPLLQEKYPVYIGIIVSAAIGISKLFKPRTVETENMEPDYEPGSGGA